MKIQKEAGLTSASSEPTAAMLLRSVRSGNSDKHFTFPLLSQRRSLSLVVRSMATPLLKRPSTQILLFIISTVGTVFVVFGFIHLVRQTHAREVAHKWSAALDASEKVPAGIGRAEDLLSRLKAIDMGYAPDEMKQALSGYIVAFQNSLDALKAGRDTAPFDKEMEQAHTKMVAAMHKYTQ